MSHLGIVTRFVPMKGVQKIKKLPKLETGGTRRNEQLVDRIGNGIEAAEWSLNQSGWILQS